MALDKKIIKMLPREKALKYGMNSLTDLELLALIIRSGNKNNNVLDISENILNSINDLQELLNYDIDSFKQINGIGIIKALELSAIICLLKRINEIKKKEFVYVNNPEVIFKLYQQSYLYVKQEHFKIIYLNAKNAYLGDDTIFIGTISQSIIHPREIFNKLLLKSAYSFICLHNHPSGNSHPSQQDIDFTKNLARLAPLIGIHLLDHIIIGVDNYFSFKENDMI